MEARNRSLKVWYGKVLHGEIKLPRFQRHEAWDRKRIKSLLKMVIQGLPLGITLTLDVGDSEKFVSRYLETAKPTEKTRVLEHLLDGQQRITALWRCFHNNYKEETYYVYINEFDNNIERKKVQEDKSIICCVRYMKGNERYPLWCDKPAICLSYGYIPTSLLKPEDIQSEIDEWITQATCPLDPGDDPIKLRGFFELKKRVSDKINEIRTVVANYNLPYLSLPSETEKSVALDVFINMNTNSKPLSQYDVIVAEVEDKTGRSLHDLLKGFNDQCPRVGKYGDLSDLVLTTSALFQEKLPNQRGAWDMAIDLMIQNWDRMENGLKRMADFLHIEGIYDRQRLPTNAVLAVIASLFEYIPVSGDKRGQDELLLKKYLWYSFFTDRYENAAATNAYADFMALKGIITGSNKKDGTKYTYGDVPIFKTHKIIEMDELLEADWPKRSTILGRAILAVFSRLKALDFATDEQLGDNNIDKRHYHHIFPDALLKEADINSFLALNCALITDSTNLNIGRKDPVQYLTERYQWVSEDIVNERLKSHLIPRNELAHGGYEALNEVDKIAKIHKDFDRFIQKRAELVMKAVNLLVAGRQINATILFKDT